MGPGPLYRLNSKENRIKEYTWLQKSGVVGVKIDFFPDDYSSNMDYYIDLLEDAAKYKLMVNFHGATMGQSGITISQYLQIVLLNIM